MIDRGDAQWYRDAIIYQLHVKSFFDSTNDGIGDFAGLAQKLDYVRDLGVTAIWLMPFYPSPLRDDGYDIADYRGTNPAFGTMRDFRRLVREAHDRGLRVITELVINHTSDQHPWFQRARKAKPGTVARNFYVWSDSDQKYKDTRIIFLDTEPSNWSWDPVAKAYYWHRFYSHQPDLNFDNPRVLEAVIEVMRFWLDIGVDGLRLDAIPYLVEREGTNCENLPETHAVIKKIRAALDAAYPDRMLLAEANQWPEDTAPYFGDGDECHMAFHFPLMPRMYMAIAQEDRHPITDIMRQTPDIPDGAQWAIFLRNHDELTLEMVTAEERDYLWSFYAADRRARLNLGIRRRLAPLLENDRRKTELLVSLLLSMPGTPVLYYGDEIGMGDNIYLGDRDGVRTPMQWSPDRNGGFSRADPARLFLPAVQDPIYGYEAVNVEAQLRSPSSLLNWLRRLLAIRKTSRAFGRGTLTFLYPSNRKVLVYVREFEGDRILCVANLAPSPQAVELDLADFKGTTPVEMTGGAYFPPVGELPYLMTLPGYGFYWFRLEATPAETRFGPQPQPELFTLVFQGHAESLVTGREKTALERNAAPGFLAAQRWFAGKTSRIRSVEMIDEAILDRPARADNFPLVILKTKLRDGSEQTYFVPMALEPGEPEALLPFALARVRRGPRVGLLYDAATSGPFAATMVAAMMDGQAIKTRSGGEMRFRGMAALGQELQRPEAELAPRRLTGEQSNTSIAFGEVMVMKLYRRLQSGIHPELEVGRFLTEAGFANTPALLGSLEHVAADGTPTALAVLQRFVHNQGDAWTRVVSFLVREFETRALVPEEAAPPLAEGFGGMLQYAATLGRRTAEMHLAFARPTSDPAFAAEPFAAADRKDAIADARAQAARAFAALERIRDPGEAAADLLARRGDVEAAIADLATRPFGGLKTRIHGDYHLGQVLIVQDDVSIVDFEGEPSRPAAERRAKASPLRDVAGMLRSFAYAGAAAAKDLGGRMPEAMPRIEAIAEAAHALAVQAFLDGYAIACGDSPVWIADGAVRGSMLRLFLLTKALYEIAYEANNRPDWIDTPIAGVLSLMETEPA
jgi:maltose alpha-D-glucosyltransferase/alpha-amylase